MIDYLSFTAFSYAHFLTSCKLLGQPKTFISSHATSYNLSSPIKLFLAYSDCSIQKANSVERAETYFG